MCCMIKKVIKIRLLKLSGFMANFSPNISIVSKCPVQFEKYLLSICVKVLCSRGKRTS